MSEEQITISVLEQEYKIKCDDTQVELLQKSAALLDSKMAEIKKDSPAMTKDKIAVMAALNLVSLYISQEDELNEYSKVTDELNALQETIDGYRVDE
ncbi:MAG: hypothetical protein CMD43_05320 [Gammaproteobacteria bacterium]|nr:hypothetical protein [Gammaproteobacteria bacterium]|tara:strand:- start:770 stop:1060 length:291 start_codon:yes stop_codon:yes gene_type:complete